MVTLDEVKNHLKIEHSEEDQYILSLIQTAIEFCENFTGVELRQLADIPNSIKQAVFLLCGFFYENREASNETKALPQAVASLLYPYKNYRW